MTLYEELVARGLIAQVTNEEEVSRLINEARPHSISALIPRRTPSMWGHFMALCLMKRLQMAGNRPSP